VISLTAVITAQAAIKTKKNKNHHSLKPKSLQKFTATPQKSNQHKSLLKGKDQKAL
jgi:hypothetical protein